MWGIRSLLDMHVLIKLDHRQVILDVNADMKSNQNVNDLF